MGAAIGLPMLNGFVNYNSWVPEKTMANPAVTAFLERYSKRAAAEKVDPLGFYLPPFNYAIGEMLALGPSAPFPAVNLVVLLLMALVAMPVAVRRSTSAACTSVPTAIGVAGST